MPNRLKDESSPYLLQHAENPVDWHPWDEQAFELAKREDKPIFLSVGYAACHWCHVMAHESFEDPQIAAQMNEHFVNIKVDREERPDVDSLYMNAVVAMTGQGGWPMSVFLTPQGEPFYGGTYFPPTRRFNMPSFPEILHAVQDAWANKRPQLLDSGQDLSRRLKDTPRLIPAQADQQIDSPILDQAAEALFNQYDWKHGGWGPAPKFPQPLAIEFLMRRFVQRNDRLAWKMAQDALEKMSTGGIYDQLGGGFARYSVDALWLIPHFEKMLYDNAQLLRVYVHAWQLNTDPAFKQIIDQTYEFLCRELRHPQGGFYSSLDADSEGEEGRFYIWEAEEIEDHLKDPLQRQIFQSAYGIETDGNFEGRSILYRARSIRELAEQFDVPTEEVETRLVEARQTLFLVRADRPRPGLDDKILTSWNGLTLSALADMARATGEPDVLEKAQALAHFLHDSLFVEGRLLRSWRQGQARFEAYLEDYAALAEGMLALYQVDFNPLWFDTALSCARTLFEAFRDPQGGFFDTHQEKNDLLARPKSIQDSPIPSGNALAAQLLLQLHALTGEGDFLKSAEEALIAIQETAARHPTSFAGWLNAMSFYLSPQLQLALIGDPESSDFQALYQTIARRYLPQMVVAGAHDARPDPALLQDRHQQAGQATAFLCQGFTCHLPTTDPQTLQAQLEETLQSGN